MGRHEIVILISAALILCGYVAWQFPFNKEAREEKLRLALQSARTAAETWDIYNRARAGSHIEAEARSRFLSAASRELRTASTFDEVCALLDLLFVDDDGLRSLYAEAHQKALDLCASADDAESVWELTEEDSPFERAAMSRLLQLTDTVEDCIDLVDTYGCDSEWGELAILRAAEILKPE